jgi:hypothetical protein
MLKIGKFFEASVFASSRRGGRMMEWWNIGKSKIPSLAGLFLKGNISLINSLVNLAYSGSNKSLSRFPKNHYSIIPVFQLGEAPKFKFLGNKSLRSDRPE